MIRNGRKNSELLELAKSVRELKIDILRHQISPALSGQISHLDATFINHMLNEIDQAIIILSEIETEGAPNPVSPLHLNKLWLLDAEGHAITIAKLLDPTEKLKVKEAKKLAKRFAHLWAKTKEFIGYLDQRFHLPLIHQMGKHTIVRR